MKESQHAKAAHRLRADMPFFRYSGTRTESARRFRQSYANKGDRGRKATTRFYGYRVSVIGIPNRAIVC